MFSLVTTGRDDYGNVRPRLQLWLFSVLSSNEAFGDNNNNDDDGEDDDDDDDDDDDEEVHVHVRYCQRNNMTGGRSVIPTIKLILAVSLILASVLSSCTAKISDKRLCYDKACSGIYIYVQLKPYFSLLVTSP
jgi:hypothetical protein